jgi:hypothetical protein
MTMDPTKDHSRVTPAGQAAGKIMAGLADRSCASLAREGEPDERCKSCAFRLGTVPNGCPQTQLDVIKAVSEAVPFMCHQHKKGERNVCFGWYALRVATRRMEEATGKTLPPCDWEFSPPDAPKGENP